MTSSSFNGLGNTRGNISGSTFPTDCPSVVPSSFSILFASPCLPHVRWGLRVSENQTLNCRWSKDVADEVFRPMFAVIWATDQAIEATPHKEFSE